MQVWWDRWPGRREAELESFRRHGHEFSQDNDEFADGRLVLRGSVSVDGKDIQLAIVYPDSYPWTRFSVLAPDLDLPRHQHPFGKNLCVFPRASEHWNRTMLAGDVVNERVPELIEAVRRGGEYLRQIEDPQSEPYTDYYTYWPLGGIIVPAEIMGAAKDVAGGEFTIRMSRSAAWLEAIGRGVNGNVPPVRNGTVTSLKHDGQLLARVPEALESSLTGPVLAGSWVRLAEPPDSSSANGFMGQVLRQHPRLKTSRVRSGSNIVSDVLAVVFEEEVAQGVMDDAWVFVVSTLSKQRKQAKGHQRRRSEPPERVLIRGMRGGIAHLAERIPELAPLRDAKVAVVGLGTLGSPLAKELARNLVLELHLVDHDFVDAGNSVRWEKGFDQAGISKPWALADDLRRNYPYTNVVPHGTPVGATPQAGGDGDRELFAQIVDGSALVIDATAEGNATAALAEAAWDAGVPLVSVWSIEGFGGVVARIVPGETGGFHCLELHMHPDKGTVNLPLPPENPHRIQPRGCADPTFTSPAPDLLSLVNQASRMAFGELCTGRDDGYPRYPSDIYVFWLRHPDGSLHDPPHWDDHALTAHPECPCHDAR